MTRLFSIRLRFSVHVFFALMMALLLLNPTPPALADGISSYSGRWIGTGYLLLRKGGREKINCRATYFPFVSQQRLHQNIRCVSVAGMKFEFKNKVKKNGSSLHGKWQELFTKRSGGLEGTWLENGFRLEVNSFRREAVINLFRRENYQRISIRTEGKHIKGIRIDLFRN